jgi:hypothetical protein
VNTLHKGDDDDDDDDDDTASNACLKIGELFPETTGLTIAFQDRVINVNN